MEQVKVLYLEFTTPGKKEGEVETITIRINDPKANADFIVPTSMAAIETHSVFGETTTRSKAYFRVRTTTNVDFDHEF